jgi:outer membrane protein OmpU
MDNQPREYSVKKQLMAGTALVAATMFIAGGAVAAEKKKMKPSISVNGYYEGVVGGILDEDMGADTSALDTRTDAEIHFNGRATLDSGIKMHAHVELEGQNHHSGPYGGGGDPIDEYFLSLSGSFGQITLGGTGGAPVKMLTGLSGSWATGVGESLSFNDDWVDSVSGGKGHGFYTMRHSRLDTGDAEKVTYISPKFGGFQVGATYSPNMQNHDSNARINATAERHDGLEGAVSYGGKFGNVGFGVGAGMTAYQGGTEGTPGNSSDWLVAARLDFGGGFRVSIAHKRVTNDADAEQGSLTDIGARFVQGANQFSLVGMHGEMDLSDASHTKIIGSYARILGPGAKIHMNLLWNESASPNGDSENGGVAAVVGVRVGF